MCGIVGIISLSATSSRPNGNKQISVDLYDSLVALQHRGQDSAGITTGRDCFYSKKGMGLVQEVFDRADLLSLKGNMGLGHVRYPTVGKGSFEDSQPFIVNFPYGIAMAHNGNVFNFWQLKQEICKTKYCLVNSNNDIEVILNIFATELYKNRTEDFFFSLCQAVRGVYQQAKGAYSVIAMIAGKGLVIFRDPHGIRPLVWGQKKNGDVKEHIFASENTMFEILGFDFFRDVSPGEVVFVGLDGQLRTERLTIKEFRPCIFEYVYFARSDAYLNHVSVHRARLRMGQNLGKRIKRDYPNLPIDVVIPVPQTATTAGLSCAHELGARYTEGLLKNNFIGRTFIMPENEERKKANRYKLSAIDLEIRDKNVLVVDDSIVRGNVSCHIVKLMRKHGAKKVYFASVSPPLRWPDVYGIDLPTRDEYIAYKRMHEDIQKHIGADLLIYQDLKDLIEAVTRKGEVEFNKPHCAYFDGDYATGDVDEKVLQEVEIRRRMERGDKKV